MEKKGRVTPRTESPRSSREAAWQSGECGRWGQTHLVGLDLRTDPRMTSGLDP